jgi:acyl transferase domain-containing protein/3-hydroxymyristoyl/3-hydroxydecanoyl-(acyl carrier protein) dehydratase
MTAFPPIAIVGRACVLPGAHSPAEFTSAVLEGRDLLGSAPAGRWRIDPDLIHGPVDAPDPDRAWSDRGGYVEGFGFDPRGFELPAEHLVQLDPLFQWLLHCGRAALADAGVGPGELRRRAGVIVGNLSFPSTLLSEWAEGVWRARRERPHPVNRFMSGLPAHTVAQALGLGRDAFALDAACASSLYALKLACDRLHDGSADVMLAGAVNRADDLFIHVGFCALRAMSRSGRSRPFHAEADGLVPAEGAALFVLRRLDDAVAAGQRIFGVIRGVGLSNDGRGSGLLAPAEEGQERAMRAAYAMAGLSPSDVSLLECHATGTPVGDATEVRSSARVFAGHPGLPVGSVKSNLGHLITAAGSAALLKVLGGFEHGLRPRTLHVDRPTEALAGTPFHLLTQALPWPEAEAPRRAAVSAFGFGGNNGHLLVEEYRPAERRAIAPGAAAPAEPLAIVAAGACVAGGESAARFVRDLLSGESRVRVVAGVGEAAAAEELRIDGAGLKFPPRDLQHALPQQLLVLQAVREALEAGPKLPRERTSVLVGMQTDAEVARNGARWRAAQWAREASLDDAWRDAARGALCAPLDSAGVVGTMPNIVANRLTSQFDLAGPGYSVSAEELSGVRALEIAARGLRAGEIDAAVVAAVDLCAEPVHAAAAQQVLPALQHVPGDAAVALVVRRLADALRDGDPVLARIDAEPAGAALAFGSGRGALSLEERFGHPHAASGLLHVLAAAVAVAHGARPAAATGDAATPWLGPDRHAIVRVDALGRQSASVHLRNAGPRRPAAIAPLPRLHLFAGESPRDLRRALDAGRAGGDGPCRLALVATAGELPARIEAARRYLDLRGQAPDQPPPQGVAFRKEPAGGELAFVFTGPAGSYSGMGASLLLALPELQERLEARFPGVGDAAGWVYDGRVPRDADKLWGSSMLCQAHAELTLRLVGLAPQAAIGFCAGETNALYALGAWNDVEALRREIDECGVYDRELAGEFRALQRAWGTPPGERPRFESWRVLAPLDRVREAVAAEPRVHLSIVNAPGDAVISGDPEGCARAIAKLGPERARSLGYDMVIHVPELAAFEDGWRRLHTRKTSPVPGVRFYSQAFMGAYAPDAEKAAEALTGQALRTVDFPALVEKAYHDGVRVFLEHGPQGGCARWISRTLGSRDHVAAPLDIAGVPPVEQALAAIGWMWAAGLSPDVAALHERLARAESALFPRERAHALPLHFPAHPPVPQLPPVPAAATRVDDPMPAAPDLPSALAEWGLAPLHRPQPATKAEAPKAAPAASIGAPPATASAPRAAAPITAPARTEPAAALATAPRPLAAVAAAPGPALGSPAAAPRLLTGPAAALAAEHARVARVHAEFLRTQAESQARFLATLRFPSQIPTASPTPTALHAPTAVQIPTAALTPTAVRIPTVPPGPTAERVPTAAPVPPAVPRPALEPTPTRSTPLSSRTTFPGPAFTRAQLETLASGRISSVFGEAFARQDGYLRQVRMPEPPLLLADRVLGIEGEPGTMGTGTIWTETDVAPGAFYLHENRMPAGILIESGQADLLLISWLGVDFLNQGERVYRLLGCELTYHGHLPVAGETLRYAITVDGHAAQGPVRLFFFHYDCEVAGRRQISVRGGQAGFFTNEELADSGGVLWDPAAETPKPSPRLDPPAVPAVATRLSRAQLEAFAAGRAHEAFGDGFLRAATHVQPPRIAGGDMLLLHEVEELAPRGGPWQRGYLRARWDFTPDDWFFDGHFKNDPCMPGTLMFEGCLQTMAVYLAAHGYTLARDGWRFEPVPEVAYKLRCRGQAIPASKTLVYELFVEEIEDGPEPTLWADLLCTVDGLKAFHCRRMGLRLVPDVPLTRKPELVASLPAKPAASGLGITFDDHAVLACAWGRSSEAFGTLYPAFDGPDRLPRLPGPPFFYMSRITKVEGELGNRRAGATIECTWDVDPAAWFFSAGGGDTAPFCVLLEAMLQPCGWLALASGSALAAGDARGLHFRNLDGTGRLLRELRPGDGPLVTRVTLKDVSASAGMILVAFDVDGRVGGLPFFTIQTGFGFFPAAALAQQVGTGITAEEKAWAERATEATLDLATLRARAPRTAGSELFMFDRITGFWPTAGGAGLGRIRGEKDVRAEEWFFKAHFFQDPVMPGSLGLEALLQLLQAYMLATGLSAEGERFGPLDPGQELVWKYRGQVVPERRKVLLELEITAAGRDAAGAFARADGWLTVDGIRIYAAKNLSMRSSPRS